jgi:O-antigen/teichoic acid export membrane protein
MSNTFGYLKSAVKNVAFILSGSVGGVGLWFLVRVLIVRSVTPEELGYYQLVVSMVGLLSLLATLGLITGAAKHISIYRHEDSPEKAKGVSATSFKIGLLASGFVTVVVYLLADPIARHVFYDLKLITPIKISSFFILFNALSVILLSILQGYGFIRSRAYFLTVGQPALLLVLVLVTSLLKLSYLYYIASFSLAMAGNLIGVVIYARRNIAFNPLDPAGFPGFRKLLAFSLPLLGATIMSAIFLRMDILIVGRYLDIVQVGIYGVAISLVGLLSFSHAAASFVFLPLAGEMHKKNERKELKRSYQVLTKWIFMSTLPVFFIMFFFPEMTISFIFGKAYVSAAAPLRILSIGFLFFVFVGSNTMLLTLFGFSMHILAITSLSAFVNLTLNYILLKHVGTGIEGVAFATSISFFLNFGLNTILLYRKTGIHPITKSYIKPIIGIMVVSIPVYALAKSLPLHFFMVPAYLLIFLIGYAAVLLFSRSIEQEDIALFDAVTRRLGVDLKRIRSLLLRFSG